MFFYTFKEILRQSVDMLFSTYFVCETVNENHTNIFLIKNAFVEDIRVKELGLIDIAQCSYTHEERSGIECISI